MKDCESCEVVDSCIYYQVYERPYARVGHAPPPRPVVLIPPFFGKRILLRREGRIEMGMLLFGDYIRHLPHILIAIQQFGSHGVAEGRYFGKNRFELERATCNFSGRIVFDGAIYPNHLKILDAARIPSLRSWCFRVRFRTPIELPLGFPPPPEHLLHLIRHRLILFVNEYGTGEKILEFKCRGYVKTIAAHHHRLPGYSKRSGRREFWKCWTGIADYEFEELDKTGQWLLGVGRVLGAGAKSSFGLGFLDIRPLAKRSGSILK
jgi:hypothetical protein